MRDDTQLADVSTHDDSPAGTGAAAPTASNLTLPLNAVSLLGATLSGLIGDAVDVINNLTQGVLLKQVPGVPPGPRVRTFELAALPDAGTGELALPALGAVPRAGTIAAVNDGGAQVASGGTGLSFTTGAYAASLDPISTTLSIADGWTLGFSYRVPTGAKNSSKCWVSLGKRLSSNYGITVTENAGGALIATVEDPRQTLVKVTSAAVGRDAIHAARLVWSAGARTLQWFIDGAASGVAVACAWVPELGGGAVQLGTNLALATGSTPTGAIYAASFEAVASDRMNSYFAIGPSATLTAVEARSLRVDTGGILTPVASAGDVTLSYPTVAGDGGEVFTIGYAGYVAPVETLTSYVAAEMPFCPIDQGSADPNYSALVLTPPARGKIQTGLSTDYLDVGSLANVIGDGIPQRQFLQYQPIAGGTNRGQNPAGSMQRGASDVVRTQQGASVRVTNLIEMNRPPRLNGGGEAWGHADDIWVPIHALLYGYNDASLLFPTIDGETPTVTVAEVPALGEGTIRVLRTGADLRVGDAVAYADVKRLGWYKPGVSAVSAACTLRLTIAVPGAPDATESYAMKMTDAPRAAALSWWEQADTLHSDRHSRIRWANRGGDWLGTDGLWGSVPFVTAPLVTRGSAVLTLDVTAMAKVGGPEVFVANAAGTGNGTVSVVPGFYTTDSSKEPMLRVTGGARAGTYRATRSAGLSDSDSTSWKPTSTAAFPIRRGQPLLLAFDGAGSAAMLADATRIELILNVSGASSGGGALQLFRPAAQPPRPGARVAVPATPTLQRADLVTKVDSNDDWYAMLNGSDRFNSAAGAQPTNFTIANGCYYGGIPIGYNSGLSLRRAFFKVDGTGYPLVRMGRMCGWHINYQPGDDKLSSPINVSGKSAGIIATGSGSLSNVTAGYGGRTVSGYSGYTTRMQRGSTTTMTHASTSPLAPYLAFGDYDYFLSGGTNGLTTNAINPIPRMKWVWIETVHSVNSIYPDGTWANDGVFELYINGRKQCESRRLEWRVAGNDWLWDAIWFDEYNGGTSDNLVDRLWPFVVGPTYVVSTNTPIAPPAGWNVPFVTAAGTPDTVPLAYVADF